MARPARAPESPPPRRRRASVKAAPEIHSKPAAVVQSDLERQVYAMPLAFVQCRDYLHSWRPLSARWLTKFAMFEQVLICGRCEATKTRHIGSRGQQLDSPSYAYPDGYQLKGQGRMVGTDRDLIRLASVRAVLATDTVTE